jgi:hypothetical protein
MKERDRLRGRRAVVIVSGQNIDRARLQTVLAGGTPRLHSACKLESALQNPARRPPDYAHSRGGAFQVPPSTGHGSS